MKRNIVPVLILALCLMAGTIGCAGQTSTPPTDGAESAAASDTTAAAGTEVSDTTAAESAAAADSAEASGNEAAEPAAEGGNGAELVSIDPADYNITAEMLASDPMPHFSALSLEALGAYCLHTDGAGAEGAGDELYGRFLADPASVLDYLTRLGDQTARGGVSGTETAAEELCREIAYADVFWYGGTEDFAGILRAFAERSGPEGYPELIAILQAQHESAEASAP